MCHRLNCNCTVQKPLDEFYSSCYECGALIDLQFSAPMPIKSTKLTYPNAADSAIIRAQIVADWAEITEMRSQKIGWRTIVSTKCYDFGVTTIGKHYNAILESITGVVAVGRNQGRNPGVVKRRHKQQGIKFGARA